MMSNWAAGHAYIRGSKRNIFVFLLRYLGTNDGSRISATLDDYGDITIHEQFDLEDMRIKGLGMAFICLDEYELPLYDTEDHDIYSLYCAFEQTICVSAKAIAKLCRVGTVSIEIDVTDPNLQLRQLMYVDPFGRILKNEVSDNVLDDNDDLDGWVAKFDRLSTLKMNYLYKADFNTIYIPLNE